MIAADTAQIASSTAVPGADNPGVNLHGGIAIIAPLAAFGLIRSIALFWENHNAFKKTFVSPTTLPAAAMGKLAMAVAAVPVLGVEVDGPNPLPSTG